MGFFTKLRRLGFSERIGKKPVKSQIQLESMDKNLRIALWNILLSFFIEPAPSFLEHDNSWRNFYRALWHNFFNKPLDSLPNSVNEIHDQLRHLFFSWEWNEVYDFIEYVILPNSPVDIEKFKEMCNSELEHHISGYRFVGDEIAQIVEPHEIQEIETAFSNARRFRFESVYTHLKTALEKFSDKQKPDYRNSIKESISAVEAIAKIIVKDDNATLGQALKRIESKIKLPPALKTGFGNLYGYTNSEDGIRHALSEKSKCESEDAKYMLVSCSAFINYLIEKANKAGIFSK